MAASMINVTMATGITTKLVRNWRVHPDDFSTDYGLMEFGITITAQPPMNSQNWKLGNFSVFRRSLDEISSLGPPGS